MSTRVRQAFQSAAGAAGGGGGLNVEDVFSTYLYTGNGTSQTITNGIALADGVGAGTSTEFAGTGDHLRNSSGLTGSSDGKTLTFSVWYYKETTTMYLYVATDSLGSSPRIEIYDNGSGIYATLRYAAMNVLDAKLANSPPVGVWTHLVFSLDMADTANRKVYVNDVSSTSSVWYTYNDNIVDRSATYNLINSPSSGSQSWKGKLAHLYMDYTYRDLSNTTNRRLFIDSTGASTSPSTLSALSPIMYLPMTTDYSIGQNIGTGGNFTATNGTLSIANSGTEFVQGEGGLVWVKSRNVSSTAAIVDTERGASYYISPSETAAEAYNTTANINALNSDGFTVGTGNYTRVNGSGYDYASWTFRKAPKFFDVVTYTGNATFGTTISHNLGTTPGMIILKRTDAAEGWFVYHRSVYGTSGDKVLYLDTYYALSVDANAFGNTFPTSTEFTLGAGNANRSGGSYVAYLFAHNDGDANFGPTGDQDIIKCGSYTGNGSNDGPEIDLGFEPQWLLIKNATTNSAFSDWHIYDNMRGIGMGDDDVYLQANESDSESTINNLHLTPTGFKLDSSQTAVNQSGATHIYIAIRRGPMAVPTSATDVFAVETKGTLGAPAYNSGFPVDMLLVRNNKNTTFSTQAWDRLRSTFSYTNTTAVEETFSSSYLDYFDSNDGFDVAGGPDSNDIAWMWRRAPNFFDVVAYTGNGPSVNTIKHNLGVKPEMIWIKGRDTTFNWVVYHDMTASGFKRQYLNLSNGDNTVRSYNSDYGLYSEPTDTHIQIDDINADLYNGSGRQYIAYLFASLAGVSKVGSYTGNGGTSVTGTGQNIDCGFSSGARFVLIKPTNAADNWFLYDSTRGIVAGNDATLQLNLTAAQSTSSDEIDPYSSGFTILNGNNQLNRTGREYIFYAIA